MEQSQHKTKPGEEGLWGKMTFLASPIQLWTKQLSVLIFPFQSAAQNCQAISVRDVMLFPCFPGSFSAEALIQQITLAVGKELETIVKFMEQEQQSL